MSSSSLGKAREGFSAKGTYCLLYAITVLRGSLRGAKKEEKMGQIGVPQKEYVVEPLVEPVPAPVPESVPREVEEEVKEPVPV